MGSMMGGIWTALSFETAMHRTPRARLVAYGLALLAPTVSLLLRWALWPMLGNAVPFMGFFPGVIVAAYVGGLWPGLLATLLSVVAADFFFLEPGYWLVVPDRAGFAGLGLFVLTSTMLSVLSEALHRGRQRLVEEERWRGEEARREAEERFRQLAENIHELFWVRNLADDRFEYMSLGYEELTGRTRAQLCDDPRSWLDAVHPDDLPAVKENLEQRRRGVFTDAEFRLVRTDGSVRWVRSRAFPMNSSGGGQSRIGGLTEDITERKRAEEALRESRARLTRLLDALPAAAYTCDTNGLITYFNERATELWGRSPKLNHTDDRFCGSTRLFGNDGNRVAPDQCWMAIAIKEEREFRGVEAIVERPDGSRRHALAYVNPLWDSEGQMTGAVNVLVDITDLKRAEGALRESEHRWRSLTETLPQLVWTATPDGACDYFSTQWTQHTGVPEDHLLGWKWLHVLHPADREPTRRLWTHSVAGRGPYDVEYRVRRSDGEYRWFKTRGVPIRDREGAIFKWFGTCTDMTDTKVAEEELRLAKNAAESANRAKDEFLANVSHEIRTPMNAILGMTELVLDTPLTEDQRHSLKTVKSAADNLLGLINDLLDFSKIEAGKLELDPADFSLRAVLGDTLRALAVRAHRKGLELVCDIQSEVPDALVGDASRLRQVLLNLVGNAIKFTDNGEVVVRAEPIAGPTPEGHVSLRFTVRDTGIGIAPDKQASVFRAFEQEDTSTTRKYGGTGLGLTIAARLVALMGGQITVESEPRRGSTFAFTARFVRPAHPPAPVAVRAPILLHHLPVLIVDDNATNRHILEEWLRAWQMTPVAVGDGLAAMDALWHGAASGRPYALVLLDARMPDVDGLALATQIRQRAELSATRIVLLTSGDRPGDLARFREQRLNGHLLKPIQPDELLEAIYRVMSRSNGDASAPPRLAPSGDPAPSAVPVVPLRILVAEDSEFNVQLMEKLLAKRGHSVRVVGNGREALALANADDFDLMLLDLHMPELDGVRVIHAIRERERAAGSHLPVIALTARSRKEDRELCLAAGMDGFLAKPIRTDDLWATIDRVLGAGGPTDRAAMRLVDPRVLLGACGGDPAILESICRTFRAGLPEHVAAVQAAFTDGDAPRLREAAHKLFGMVAAFSTAAGSVVSDIEDHASRGQLGPVGALMDQLNTMARELPRAVARVSIDSLRRDAEIGDDCNRR
jgi:two-component system sensor histidine kinase/response regulator